MSFFKDFKEDLSQAVNELMPEDEAIKEEPAAAAPEVTEDSPTQSEDYSDLFASFDSTEEPEPAPEPVEEEPETAGEYEEVVEEVVEEVEVEEDYDGEDEEVIEEVIFVDEDGNPIDDVPEDAVIEEVEEVAEEPVAEAEPEFEAVEEPVAEEPEEAVEEYDVTESEPEDAAEPISYEDAMSELSSAAEPEPEPVFDDGPINTVQTPIFEPDPVSEPINTIWNEPKKSTSGSIIEGMTVNGNISCAGSLEVHGIVKGNLDVLGKLSITGKLEGDSQADEIFINGARVTGELLSNSSVKVAQGSVIRGNIKAAAAVLAGAIKGDIDVQGPVILDSTAVIIGNIKSKSIQINNGAIIEGSCSQIYSDVTASKYFEDED
ncbi:MAG: polymer-forming cytoskeletal protein [Lachnospiraceae bacterium]|nr:polymer-forming cytoskeletal protein [Lachnospiraceae bacterium]